MANDVFGESVSAWQVVRLGVLGYGNVGSALVAMIEKDATFIAARTGIRLEVTRIVVRDLSKERAVALSSREVSTDPHTVTTADDVDIVIELIGGIEPARSLIAEALENGKSVVTANKELLANAGPELEKIAETADRDLLFEASVGGAIPMLRTLRVSLAGEPIRRVIGIVNGTTNYILSRMSAEGIGYREALQAAQDLGYAESDPTADVKGYDAAAKAAILAGIAFDASVRATDVFCEGIESIEASDISFARQLGYEVKLVAVIERDDRLADVPHSAIAVRVHPAMVPVDHPLASVHGAFNAVFVEGEFSGELMLLGQGAGGLATASAVLGDVLDAAHGLSGPSHLRFAARNTVEIRPIGDLRTQYYLAIEVFDRPGVLAMVATVFGKHDISIRSMEQIGLGGEARLVFITHEAQEADIQATVAELTALESVKRVGQRLRLIGPER